MNPNLPDPGENGSAAEWAAIDARKFRQRVVETARAAWVQTAHLWVESVVRTRGMDTIHEPDLIDAAAEFERCVAEYLAGGAK